MIEMKQISETNSDLNESPQMEYVKASFDKLQKIILVRVESNILRN